MLVPPGSDDTPLLRCKTQSSVPSSFHTALSKLVGSSPPVWVEAGDSRSGRKLGGGWFTGAEAVLAPTIAALPVGTVVLPHEGHSGWR